MTKQIKRVKCPKCGSTKLASCPGGTHVEISNPKIKCICQKCLYEF